MVGNDTVSNNKDTLLNEEQILEELQMLKMTVRALEKEKLEIADRMDLFSANIDAKRIYLEEFTTSQKKRQKMLKLKVKKYKKYLVSWWLLSLVFVSSLNLVIALSISALIGFVFFSTILFLLLVFGYAYLQRTCKEDIHKLKEEHKQIDTYLIQNDQTSMFDYNRTSNLIFNDDSVEFVEEMFRTFNQNNSNSMERTENTEKSQINKNKEKTDSGNRFSSSSLFWKKRGLNENTHEKKEVKKDKKIVDDSDNIFTGTLSIDDDDFLASIETKATHDLPVGSEKINKEVKESSKVGNPHQNYTDGEKSTLNMGDKCKDDNVTLYSEINLDTDQERNSTIDETKGSFQPETSVNEGTQSSTTTVKKVIEGIGGIGYKALGTVFPISKTGLKAGKPANKDNSKVSLNETSARVEKSESPKVTRGFSSLGNNTPMNEIGLETDPLTKKVQ